MSTPTPTFLRGLPHGIDITAPGGLDALLDFHRATFGDAQMNTAPGAGESGESGGGESSKKKPEPRTFSQDELNAILAEDRRKNSEKFADYDDLKAKADKFDQAEQENQSELQKAVARAEKAERSLGEEQAARAAAERQSLAATVAGEKGVPASNISGTTREELEASADALITWRGGQKQEQKQEEPPKVGGHVPYSGTGNPGSAPATLLSGRERAEAKHTSTKN